MVDNIVEAKEPQMLNRTWETAAVTNAIVLASHYNAETDLAKKLDIAVSIMLITMSTTVSDLNATRLISAAKNLSSF